MMRTCLVRAAILAGAALLAPAAAFADPILVSGNALGCFGVGCTPGESAAITIGGVSLSYQSSAGRDFSGTTADNLLAIEAGTGNFGSIGVGTSSPSASISVPFTLLISFNSLNAPNTVFDSTIAGVVSFLNTGGITVDFNPAPGRTNVSQTLELAFVDPATNQSGQMFVSAFGLPISSGGRSEIGGFIETAPQPAAVPEPGSMLLLGLGGIGLFRRRK